MSEEQKKFEAAAKSAGSWRSKVSAGGVVLLFGSLFLGGLAKGGGNLTVVAKVVGSVGLAAIVVGLGATLIYNLKNKRRDATQPTEPGS
jgi:hypothetical protein